MKRLHSWRAWGLVVVALTLYALHQDVWLFKTAQPLLGGFLPIGLTYHAAYCLACALLMWLLVAQAWPHRLEDEARGDSRGTPPS